MGPATRALNTVSAVDALTDDIRAQILAGQLAPGSRLLEGETATTYRVGRYTARAAFQALAHLGLAVHEPNRGVAVFQPTAEVVRDLYVYRAALETEGVRVAIEGGVSLEPAHVALEALLAAVSGESWVDILKADLAFHRSLFVCGGNRRLLHAFDDIVDQLRLCLLVFDPGGRQAATIPDDHRRILVAVSSGDVATATEVVRGHLFDVVEAIEAGQTQ